MIKHVSGCFHAETDLKPTDEAQSVYQKKQFLHLFHVCSIQLCCRSTRPLMTIKTCSGVVHGAQTLTLLTTVECWPHLPFSLYPPQASGCFLEISLFRKTFPNSECVLNNCEAKMNNCGLKDTWGACEIQRGAATNRNVTFLLLPNKK